MVEFFAVYVVLYCLYAMGITIGYHRLLAHRSFACSKPVEYFWVALGYLAFEGSPIWWSTIHRAHHRHVDTPLDPHSPRNGLMYSLTGWLNEKEYADHIDPKIQSKDLISDPIYRFLDQGGNLPRGHALNFALNFTIRALMVPIFGWKIALASLLAGLSVLGIPLMLNVICHLPNYGYANYAVEDDSTNVWWVGLLAMGEGWHNNHHVAPGSARSGVRPWEFDMSWLTIAFMRKLGLVYRVNEATHETLLKKFGPARSPKVVPNVSAPVSGQAAGQMAEQMAAALEARLPADSLVTADSDSARAHGQRSRALVKR